MMYIFLYTADIFKTKNYITRIFLEHECIFCGVNVTFYDAVNMIHDVIITADSYPDTAKFMFVGVK